LDTLYTAKFYSDAIEHEMASQYSSSTICPWIGCERAVHQQYTRRCAHQQCGEFHAPFFFCLEENDDMSRIGPHCPMKPKECQDLIHEYAMVNISQGIQHSYRYVCQHTLGICEWRGLKKCRGDEVARCRKCNAAGLESGVSEELKVPQWHGTETDSRYKFRLDLDGFAWTTRWKRELSTVSVVLKATLYVSGLLYLCALKPR
jgi:hypothetical protein